MELASAPRSFLYVPADRSDLFVKAARSGADAVILDLEDAVIPSRRTDARLAVSDWLRSVDATDAPQWWCRLDPTELDHSAKVLSSPALSGVLLAKVDIGTLDRMADLLTQVDRSSALQIIGLVETAATHANLNEVARHRVLTTLGIGEVDLLADLGITAHDGTASVINGLRLEVVRQCAAAGLRPPVAPTSTDFNDTSAFTRSTALLRDLGFGARTAVHPRQIPVIHEELNPTPEAVAEARNLLARFDAAHGAVTLDDHGRLIDAAVMRQAQNILARVR